VRWAGPGGRYGEARDELEDAVQRKRLLVQQLQLVMRGAEGAEGRLLVHVSGAEVRLAAGGGGGGGGGGAEAGGLRVKLQSSHLVARLGGTSHLAGRVGGGGHGGGAGRESKSEGGGFFGGDGYIDTTGGGQAEGEAAGGEGVDGGAAAAAAAAAMAATAAPQRVMHFELDGDELELRLELHPIVGTAGGRGGGGGSAETLAAATPYAALALATAAISFLKSAPAQDVWLPLRAAAPGLAGGGDGAATVGDGPPLRTVGHFAGPPVDGLGRYAAWPPTRTPACSHARTHTHMPAARMMRGRQLPRGSLRAFVRRAAPLLACLLPPMC
jgi:hypothetical protein